MDQMPPFQLLKPQDISWEVPEVTQIMRLLSDSLERKILAQSRAKKDEDDGPFPRELNLMYPVIEAANLSSNVGQHPDNSCKNRYKDVLPYDYNRVILEGMSSCFPSNNYINASFIRGPTGARSFIAAQGPLPATVGDFWRMVVQQKISTIVMLCKDRDGLTNKGKCEQYFPRGKKHEQCEFDGIEVTLLNEDIEKGRDYVIREFRVRDSSKVSKDRTIFHYHYTEWEDKGVPGRASPLVDMLLLIRERQPSRATPILVHCSAGCGRTGVFCALDIIYSMLCLGVARLIDLSIYQIVVGLRLQRRGMVQTPQQYCLVHQAAMVLFGQIQNKIASVPSNEIGNLLASMMAELHQDSIYQPSKAVLAQRVAVPKGEETQEDSVFSSTFDTVDGKENGVDNVCSSLDSCTPPLVQKRFSNPASSKLEKEAENITEKNRLSSSFKPDSSEESFNQSVKTRPKIAKLRALFEKSGPNFDSKMTRSHSIGPVVISKSAPFVQSFSEDSDDYSVRKKPEVRVSAPGTIKRSKSLTINETMLRSRESQIVNQPKETIEPGLWLGVRERRNSFRCAMSSRSRVIYVGEKTDITHSTRHTRNGIASSQSMRVRSATRLITKPIESSYLSVPPQISADYSKTLKKEPEYARTNYRGVNSRLRPKDEKGLYGDPRVRTVERDSRGHNVEHELYGDTQLSGSSTS